MICSQCGVSIYEQEKLQHQNWHKRLDDAIQGLMDWRKVETAHRELTHKESWIDGFNSGFQVGLVKQKENPRG